MQTWDAALCIPPKRLCVRKSVIHSTDLHYASCVFRIAFVSWQQRWRRMHEHIQFELLSHESKNESIFDVLVLTDVLRLFHETNLQ